MNILIINAGSSSLKIQLIEAKKDNYICLYKGMIDALYLKTSTLRESYKNKNFTASFTKLDHEQALKNLIKSIEKADIIKNLNEIDAIGHRVVHGGEEYTKITRINEKVKKAIHYYSQFAPLHNPANLTAIEACQKLFPRLPQFAVFDTAFHQTMPKKAFLYALSYAHYKVSGIRRFGFHGTNHRYIAEKTQKLLRKKNSKIISCHLGNGSSITAIQNGESIDTSMGFTPLEGIPMGTRSGDIDPAIIFYLMRKSKMKAEEIENMLNKQSGIAGISEISSDVREIWAKAQQKNTQALLTLEVLAYRIAKYIGAYTAALNGIDAITFTAGVGENAWYLRRKICSYFSYLGLELAPQKNKKNSEEISSKKSKVRVFVIPANEEKQIAREVQEKLTQKHF